MRAGSWLAREGKLLDNTKDLPGDDEGETDLGAHLMVLHKEIGKSYF